jgi:hypothetical protein
MHNKILRNMAGKNNFNHALHMVYHVMCRHQIFLMYA